jgi:hypothetical protein
MGGSACTQKKNTYFTLGTRLKQQNLNIPFAESSIPLPAMLFDGQTHLK